MKASIKKANDYINKHKDGINKRFRPVFHIAPPIGWMNDPNGMIYYNKEYHLFFQYNPYKPKWDTMHWGHYTSKDLISWFWQGVALAPDKEYDKDLGVFSGTAFEHNGQLKLFYTGVRILDGVEHQQQCLAFSSDAIKFDKFKNNPIIKTIDYPKGFDTCARDPKVFLRDGKFYMLIGSKNLANPNYPLGGQILLFSSYDTLNWQFVDAILKTEVITSNGFLECPDIALIDGQDVLFCSPQGLKMDGIRFHNPQSNVYFVGKLDIDKASFSYTEFDEIDSGFNFYASQTLKAHDGRTILLAWMNLFSDEYPSASDGWAGTMCLARELCLVNNKLIQTPIRELKDYQQNCVEYYDILVDENKSIKLENIEGNCIDLELILDINGCDEAKISFLAGASNKTILSFNKNNSIITLDRSMSGVKIQTFNNDSYVRKVRLKIDKGILNIRLILDKCIAEVFLQHGEKTMTSAIFTDKENKGIIFEASGGAFKIIKAIKYDIIKDRE